jgi:hypothetical protein
MIWRCQWCAQPRIVPDSNPVTYVCDGCGREAVGIIEPPVFDRVLTEEERELVHIRVTWSGVVPDNGTVRALRLLDQELGDQSLAAVVDALRQKGHYSLGVHARIDVGRVADDARALGLHVVVEPAG